MKHHLFQGALAIMILAATVTGQAEEIRIQIDPTIVHQTIESFGASGAWWAQDVGGWEDEVRTRIVQLLFDPQIGIGLSSYRYNIGAGAGQNIDDPWRRGETFEVAPGAYDWGRDANAVWVLKQAQQLGVKNFVAFVNSPPARMTVSGLVSGELSGKSNLRPEMTADFAQYLVAIVRHLQGNEGIPIGWISPVNEPQWDWGTKQQQEGCHYSPAETAAVVQALLTEIDNSGLDVAVSAPESGEWKASFSYADALFQDQPELVERLGHFAVHSYWSNAAEKRSFAQYVQENYPGLKLWMSEWTEMQSGQDVGMESALRLAETMQDDLTIGGVVNWHYWIAVSKYDWRDGLIYVDENTHAMQLTKRLWALGNFSRFIRPGAVRIEATSSDTLLKTSAYRAAEGERLILVLANLRSIPREITLTLNNADQFTAMQVFETSAAHDLELVFDGKLATALSIAPHSVTTLVFSGK